MMWQGQNQQQRQQQRNMPRSNQPQQQLISCMRKKRRRLVVWQSRSSARRSGQPSGKLHRSHLSLASGCLVASPLKVPCTPVAFAGFWVLFGVHAGSSSTPPLVKIIVSANSCSDGSQAAFTRSNIPLLLMQEIDRSRQGSGNQDRGAVQSNIDEFPRGRSRWSSHHNFSCTHSIQHVCNEMPDISSVPAAGAAAHQDAKVQPHGQPQHTGMRATNSGELPASDARGPDDFTTQGDEATASQIHQIGLQDSNRSPTLHLLPKLRGVLIRITSLSMSRLQLQIWPRQCLGQASRHLHRSASCRPWKLRLRAAALQV